MNRLLFCYIFLIFFTTTTTQTMESDPVINDSEKYLDEFLDYCIQGDSDQESQASVYALLLDIKQEPLFNDGNETLPPFSSEFDEKSNQNDHEQIKIKSEKTTIKKEEIPCPHDKCPTTRTCMELIELHINHKHLKKPTVICNDCKQLFYHKEIFDLHKKFNLCISYELTYESID